MLIILMALLLLYSPAFAQVACFDYGSMLSCDGPAGNTTIAQLTDRQGVITQHGHGRNTLEPYTIIAPKPRPHRNDGPSIGPFAPLAPSMSLGPPAMSGVELPSLELPGLELP